MIFVTVGTQLPFDRMIEAVDDWAGGAATRDVFAQIGPSDYKPRHIEHTSFIAPAECRERMAAAQLVVAHAGMGSILSALELGTPVLVMPRLASLGEHRNEHQLATAKRMGELGHVTVADDERALVRLLDRFDADATDAIGPYASPRLLSALSDFIRA